MKNILVITENELLKWNFNGSESISYGICGVSECNDERRFLVREPIIPADNNYSYRDSASASVEGDFVYSVYELAHKRSLPCVAFIHTHPGKAFFSQKDDQDAERHQKVVADFGIKYYIRLVIGKDGLVASVNSSNGSVPIDYILIYKTKGIEVVLPKNSDFRPVASLDYELHNRTLQIGGGIDSALKTIRFLKFGVIGVGGGGSAFVNVLKFLGAKHFTLIDPDTLEKSNANRFMGYHSGDEGKPKVDVIKRELLAYDSSMDVETIQEPFPSDNTEKALKNCDIIVTVPDHHWVRIKASEFAALHLKPLFSGGAGVYVTDDGMPYRISCSTWFQLPTPLGPCLKCLGIEAGLPPMYEQMVFEAKSSYIKGLINPGPTPASVVTLHNQLGNLLARQILFYLSDISDKPVPLHLVYDEIPLRFENLTSLYDRIDGCNICGDKAFWGYGDYAPKLPNKEEIQDLSEVELPPLYDVSES